MILKKLEFMAKAIGKCERGAKKQSDELTGINDMKSNGEKSRQT